jgi:hypothetical protein
MHKKQMQWLRCEAKEVVTVKSDETTWKEEMQWSNRGYISLMKQHKHVEATPETRCVENLQLQEK